TAVGKDILVAAEEGAHRLAPSGREERVDQAQVAAVDRFLDVAADHGFVGFSIQDKSPIQSIKAAVPRAPRIWDRAGAAANVGRWGGAARAGVNENGHRLSPWPRGFPLGN